VPGGAVTAKKKEKGSEPSFAVSPAPALRERGSEPFFDVSPAPVPTSLKKRSDPFFLFFFAAA